MKNLFGEEEIAQRPKASRADKINDYEGFVEKFKPKKTTDDCYTPPAVYDAVLGWLRENADIEGCEIVRPFYPGGDYENYPYPANCVVVDNPPFSIMVKILRFYQANGIRFFLFAPHLTLFSPSQIQWTCIVANAAIKYDNGALVSTSFVSNLFGDIRIMTSPDLYQRIKRGNRGDDNRQDKYSYPMSVVTAALLGKIAKHINFKVNASECVQIRKLDCQRGKAVYGGGFLISEQKSAERAAVEREAAERAVLARAAADREAAEREALRETTVWELSEREKEIIKNLGK